MQRRLSGRINVALPPSEAFVLFTPRGEENWVPGWQPRFPVPTEDDAAPGTVFETAADGEQTIWVVIDREPGRRMSYARVTRGLRAGTVSVEIIEGDDGASVVEVIYVLTPLSPEGERELEEFAAGYVEFLKSWES